MKCAHCSNKAIYTKHRLCKEHFFSYYYNKVKKVLKYVDLENARFLVAVSGGKDSAAVAHVMKKFARNVELFYINLGIPEYSDKSFKAVEKLSETLELPLHKIDLYNSNFTIEHVYDLIGKRKLRGSVCSLCGLTKRYVINKYAYEHGFDYVVTGHNLDDELAFIFLNLKNQDLEQLKRVGPITKTDKDRKLIGRIKPLYYLTEKENMLYALLNKLPVYNDECPFASNNTQIKMKSLLNMFEAQQQGFKTNFVKSFRKIVRQLNKESMENKNEAIDFCKNCGFPTSKGRDFCRFCMLELKFKKN